MDQGWTLEEPLIDLKLLTETLNFYPLDMMRANQELDLLNQLCPEAYELESHGQLCSKQQ